MPAKGTSQFGEDVIVGSAEYWKKWREKNKDKAKLAGSKYRLKQKQLALAAKLAVDDNIPIEQALAEITGKMDAYVAVRSDLVVEGRITHHNAPPVPATEEDNDLPPVAMMVEEAEKTGLSYAEVKAGYEAAAKWNKGLTTVDEELIRLAAAKGLTPLKVADMAKGEQDESSEEVGNVTTTPK